MFSGFATKNHEHLYDRLVFKLIELMQSQIISKCAPRKLLLLFSFLTELGLEDIPFIKKTIKIQKTLRKLEGNRYNQPKESLMSASFSELSYIFLDYARKHHDKFDGYNANSETGTNLSFSKTVSDFFSTTEMSVSAKPGDFKLDLA